MRVKDPLFSLSRRLQHPQPEGATVLYPPRAALQRADLTIGVCVCGQHFKLQMNPAFV
jgi:hypothetical protein